MKQLTAILFALSLVWMQVAAAPVSKPASATPLTGACCCSCCCSEKSPAQSAPAVPAQKAGAQNQISFLALAVVAWTLPENPANLISSTVASPGPAPGAPLYEQHCARLL